MEPEKLVVRFVKEKDTKNTVRFSEVSEPGKPPVIGTLYIQRWVAGEATEVEVEVTLK